MTRNMDFTALYSGQIFLILLANNFPTLRPLIVGGLIKNRGLATFPGEINGDGANKWKRMDFVMQSLNRVVVNSWGGQRHVSKVLLKRYYDTKRYYTASYNIFDLKSSYLET